MAKILGCGATLVGIAIFNWLGIDPKWLVYALMLFVAFIVSALVDASEHEED